ncbi:4-hydroxybenzoyl-CoA thioesterase [Campylobacter ureolyticus]|uniref:4-hydroxybenzoyl-CoA thioesterase n=1 Tax=Campylobacter ureolyticus TaxID=827 RepID=A0A2I1NC29_9BACT|nr:thioesterase family protein [Campylobacter ureolyticus]PKZ29957.1 4-hydroxybenzoyl-CoA thioesterase [Campylobacter ureolyticus]
MIKKVYKNRVEFYDVDSLNVVWHGNYVKFLEAARCQFLDEIGFNYTKMKDMGFAYPVVKMEFKFINPLFFNDEFEVEVELLEIESFLKFSYLIKKGTLKICKATTSQACVEIATRQTCYEAPIFLKKLFGDKI